MDHTSNDDLIQLKRLREKLSFLQTKFDIWKKLGIDYINMDELETCEKWDRYNKEVLQTKDGAVFFSYIVSMMETFNYSLKFERSKCEALRYLARSGNELNLPCLLRCHEKLTGNLTPSPHQYMTSAERRRIRVLTGIIEEVNHRMRTLTKLANYHDTTPNTIKSWIILAGHVCFETQLLCPFADGNKRMGELLGNYILQKQGGIPFVVTLYDEEQPSPLPGGKYVYRNCGEVIQLLGSRIASKWKEYDSMSAAMSAAMTSSKDYLNGEKMSGGHAPSSSRQSHNGIRKGHDDGGTFTSAMYGSTDVHTIERAVVGDPPSCGCYYICTFQLRTGH